MTRRALAYGLLLAVLTPSAVVAQDVDGGVPRRRDAAVVRVRPPAIPEPTLSEPPAPVEAAPAPPAAESTPDVEPTPEPRPRRRPDPPSTSSELPSPVGQLIELDAGVALVDGSIGDAGALAAETLDAGALDAGAADAGAPDAGPPSPPDAGMPLGVPPEPSGAVGDVDFLGALREWMWERAERESAERELARRESAPSSTPIAERGPDDVRVVLDRSVAEWLGFGMSDRRVSTFGLVVLLALTGLALWMVHRLRRPLPERGLFPRVLGLVHLALRLTGVVMLLMLVSRILPAWLQPSLLLTIAAVAVAIGFGAVWTLLPDVVGGMVLLTEGRLKPGQWVTGEGFAGAVEHVGPRVTLLRAADGSLVTVPNRRVVKSPVQTSERRWHEVEVELRAPDDVPAAKLRQAIREAVLSSPYIPPDPSLTLSRDPREPGRWRLRLRLLHVRYAAPFEGQLVERVEEAIGNARSSTRPEAAQD
jgi:hypothetical protein